MMSIRSNGSFGRFSIDDFSSTIVRASSLSGFGGRLGSGLGGRGVISRGFSGLSINQLSIGSGGFLFLFLGGRLLRRRGRGCGGSSGGWLLGSGLGGRLVIAGVISSPALVTAVVIAVVTTVTARAAAGTTS